LEGTGVLDEAEFIEEYGWAEAQKWTLSALEARSQALGEVSAHPTVHVSVIARLFLTQA